MLRFFIYRGFSVISLFSWELVFYFSPVSFYTSPNFRVLLTCLTCDCICIMTSAFFDVWIHCLRCKQFHLYIILLNDFVLFVTLYVNVFLWYHYGCCRLKMAENISRNMFWKFWLPEYQRKVFPIRKNFILFNFESFTSVSLGLQIPRFGSLYINALMPFQAFIFIYFIFLIFP